MALFLPITIFLVVVFLSLARYNSKIFTAILSRTTSLLKPRTTVTVLMLETLLKTNSTPREAIRKSSGNLSTTPILSRSASGSFVFPCSAKRDNRYEVETVHPKDTWQRESYDSFVATLIKPSPVFPCIYATKGFKANEQRFLFIDSDHLSSISNVTAVASALTIYLPQSRQLGPNTSLVILCKLSPHARSVQNYQDIYWSFLKTLRSLDPHPWPAEFPEAIDTDNWCFCFAGIPTFTVVQTPAHQQRQSRHAPNLRIVIQPKWIFDVLFSTPKKRIGALRTVRALLREYDSVPLSPDLKNYGEEGSRESQQYFLLDENVPAQCPYDTLLMAQSPSSSA